jgi:hypothetical protein
MLSETVAAALKIRLNCKMKCDRFFQFIQNETEIIKLLKLHKSMVTKENPLTDFDIYLVLVLTLDFLMHCRIVIF